MDILAALEAEPSQGDKRCNLRAFLDAIPEDTAGRDELIRLVETPRDRNHPGNTKSGQRMAVILTNLGHECTENVVHQHRNRACACYR